MSTAEDTAVLVTVDPVQGGVQAAVEDLEDLQVSQAVEVRGGGGPQGVLGAAVTLRGLRGRLVREGTNLRCVIPRMEQARRLLVLDTAVVEGGGGILMRIRRGGSGSTS